jgi:hypothetical protein
MVYRAETVGTITVMIGVLAGGIAACSSPADPEPRLRMVRVRDCSGPATSLPAARAAALPLQGEIVTPDDRWAEIARRVPGGFAGALYDGDTPVLLLTDPGQAAAAKAALAPLRPGFDVGRAAVRQARWTFAQLYDWYLYLNTAYGEGPARTATDIDEARNRLLYGAADEAGRDRIVARLAQLDLPCDLAVVEVIEGASDLPGR